MSTTLVAPLDTQQINSDLYVGEGYLKTIQNGVNYAVAQGGMWRVVIPAGYTGSDTIAAVVNGSASVYLVDERQPQPQSYSWDGNAYLITASQAFSAGSVRALEDIEPPYVPSAQLSYGVKSGILKAIGPDTATVAGMFITGWNSDLSKSINYLICTPTDITLDSTLTLNAGAAKVDNSPVRTFANTPDSGGGPTYPPAGIGVSTGTAWDDVSIDPATLPSLSATENIFAGSVATPLLNVVDDFDPNTGNLITAFQSNMGGGTITGFLVGRNNQPLNCIRLGFQFLADESAANLGTIGFPGGSQATFDNSGNWKIPGILTVGGATSITGDVSLTGTLHAGTTMAFPGGAAIVSDGVGGIRINPASGANKNIVLNWDGGSTGIVAFGNGASGVVGTVDTSGNAQFNGTLTAGGAKNFRIPHPLNKKKYLTHSCVEGPECAVFYRGEGRTNKAGRATVTLPDYFEALTHESGRTVQLTTIFEEEDDDFGQLAASRVEDGRFRVRSSVTLQRFYWEVKAVRADVAPLEVVTARTAADDGPTAERMRQVSRDFVPAKKKAGKR